MFYFLYFRYTAAIITKIAITPMIKNRLIGVPPVVAAAASGVPVGAVCAGVASGGDVEDPAAFIPVIAKDEKLVVLPSKYVYVLSLVFSDVSSVIHFAPSHLTSLVSLRAMVLLSNHEFSTLNTTIASLMFFEVAMVKRYRK